MPGIDLHCHTTASDGLLAPADLVALAAERGLRALAVTDHDTVGGVAEAQAAGAEHGVRVVAGIELSTRLAGQGVHILGYLLEVSDEVLLARLADFKRQRLERARRMVERLCGLGYELSFEEVLAHAGGDVLARPHVARAMVDRGYVDSVSDAFTPELIADGGRAYVGRAEQTPVQAIELVRAAGGVAVLAHPAVTDRHGRLPETLVAELAAAGLAGLEVDHPDHAPLERDRLRALAGHLGLVVTGGSDYHGPGGRRLGAETTSPESLGRLEGLAGAGAAE